MTSSVTRRCLVLIADEDQCGDYSDFKSEVEEISNGVVEIEDLEDVKSADGDNDADKLRGFLERRDVIVIVCSDKMKECIDTKTVTRFNLDGNLVHLHGDVLHSFLLRDEIRKKVLIISFDSNDSIPVVLNDVTRVVKSGSVTTTFVNKFIFAARGVQA